MKLQYKGFSLIELMIVIAIIGILASIAVPSYRTYILKARTSELIAVGGSLETIVNEYVQGQGQAATNTPIAPTCTTLAYSAPSATTNLSTAAINQANCVITVTGTSTSGGVTITLTPMVQSDGSITWKCTSGNSKYAPSNCQS